MKSTKSIEKTSPLYDFWNSKQNSKDTSNRLEKTNNDSKIMGYSQLFISDAYKWEILYQTLIREIIKKETKERNGINQEPEMLDQSIGKLKKLLIMLNSEEGRAVINRLENNRIVSSYSIDQLRLSYKNNYQDVDITKNTRIGLGNLLKVLWAIFTNPYLVELKRDRSSVYEHTGYICLKIRKIWLNRKRSNYN